MADLRPRCIDCDKPIDIVSIYSGSHGLNTVNLPCQHQRGSLDFRHLADVYEPSSARGDR